MKRDRLLNLVVNLVIWAGLECFADDISQPAVDTADQSARAARMVELLGDERFATRESATSSLIEIGWPAKLALEAGVKSTDREVRFRSSRILGVIHQLDFQRRLTGFAAGRDDEQSRLPGWDAFRELFGADQAARSLFVEMQRAETELMQEIASGPQGVAKAIDLRCAQLQQAQRVYREPISLGSVAAMLLAASDANVNVGLQSASVICSFCYQQAFTTAMENSEKKDILRKMLGGWVVRGEDWTAYQCLSLAMRYELKEGLVPAVKVVKNPANQAYIRQNAILAIAKLGDESHVELLGSLLDDTSRCATQRDKNLVYESQIRDVALAALLCMRKLDPKKFGFERYQENSTNLFVTSSVGFENEQKRENVFRKWKELRRSEKKGS